MGNIESEGMSHQDLASFVDSLSSVNTAINNIASFDNFPTLIANMPTLIENLPVIINKGSAVFNSIPASAKACIKTLQDAENRIKNIENICMRLEKNIAALREQQAIIGKRLDLQGLCLQQLMLTDFVATHSAVHEEDKEVGGDCEEETKLRKEKDLKVEIEKGHAQNTKSKKKGRYQTTANASSLLDEPKSSSKAADSQASLGQPQPKPNAARSLVSAAEAGNMSQVQALLDAGASPNISGVGVTALQRAASGGHLPCVSLLLKRGARPDTSDVLGRTALHLAALHGHVDCMVELIEHKATVTLKDLSGQMPLHCAAIGGFEGAVKEIVKRGGSVDVADDFGQTPLYLAVMFDKPGSVSSLLDAGARRKNNEGKPLLNFARSDKVKGLLSRFW